MLIQDFAWQDFVWRVIRPALIEADRRPLVTFLKKRGYIVPEDRCSVLGCEREGTEFIAWYGKLPYNIFVPISGRVAFIAGEFIPMLYCVCNTPSHRLKNYPKKPGSGTPLRP